MDIKQLRYFLNVCEYGSILQASRHSFISQQALSKTISDIERELGTSLFFRQPRGIKLTEAGERLRNLAVPVVESMDFLMDDMKSFSHQSSTSIRLATTSGLQFFIDRPSVQEIMDNHPEYTLSYEEHSHSICLEMIHDNTLTAALVNGPTNDSSLLSIPMDERTRVALVHKDSPLSSREILHIEDFRDVDLLSNINNICYNSFVRKCRNLGFEPRFSRVGDTHTVFDLCNTRNYVGILVDFMTHWLPPHITDFKIIPIDKKEFSYPLELILKPEQYHREIIQELAAHLQNSIRSQIF